MIARSLFKSSVFRTRPYSSLSKSASWFSQEKPSQDQLQNEERPQTSQIQELRSDSSPLKAFAIIGTGLFAAWLVFDLVAAPRLVKQGDVSQVLAQPAHDTKTKHH